MCTIGELEASMRLDKGNPPRDPFVLDMRNGQYGVIQDSVEEPRGTVAIVTRWFFLHNRGA